MASRQDLELAGFSPRTSLAAYRLTCLGNSDGTASLAMSPHPT
jgi:hypothetical protein